MRTYDNENDAVFYSTSSHANTREFNIQRGCIHLSIQTIQMQNWRFFVQRRPNALAQFNPLAIKLFNLHLHPLEVVSRYRDTQLQVSGNCLNLTKWRSTILKSKLIIPGFTFHRGGCFFALISIFTVFSRFFLHIHLLCMMGRFYFQTIIQFSVITGCEVRK